VQVEQLVYPIDSDAGENFLIMRFSRS
jgi:hypothetical protein